MKAVQTRCPQEPSQCLAVAASLQGLAAIGLATLATSAMEFGRFTVAVMGGNASQPAQRGRHADDGSARQECSQRSYPDRDTTQALRTLTRRQLSDATSISTAATSPFMSMHDDAAALADLLVARMRAPLRRVSAAWGDTPRRSNRGQCPPAGQAAS